MAKTPRPACIMRHRHRTLLVALIVLAIATANVACRKSNRRAACEEIEAARNALTGPEATQAVATLREHARSRDSFVRTQVVLVARDVGPELGEPIREQCMDLVGEALNDPCGYVHQAAIHGLGVFGTSAERYVDSLLTISNTSHYWNVVFAIESLGRVGIGRSDVGNRLTAAITERYPINPISKDEFPYRFQAPWRWIPGATRRAPGWPSCGSSETRGMRDDSRPHRARPKSRMGQPCGPGTARKLNSSA
jgi:hypothetical protein